MANYIGALGAPADIYGHDLIKEAMQYVQQLQGGGMQNVTADHANWARNFALNQLKQSQGTKTPYDDSWVRQMTGGNTMASQQSALDYATRRAGATGDWDPSWAPAAPSPYAAQSIPQQAYALDYARALGQYRPDEVDNQGLMAMVAGGTSPQAQALQAQAAYDIYDRTRQWHPELVQTGQWGGTPTADQFMQDLYWQSVQDEMQRQAFDPVTGEYKRDVGFLQNMAEMIADWTRRAGQQFQSSTPAPAQGFTPARTADIGMGAVDRYVGQQGQPAGPQSESQAVAQSPSQRGANAATSVAQAQRYAGAYASADEFIQDINRNPQLTPQMKSQLQQWANANRFNPIWRRR